MRSPVFAVYGLIVAGCLVAGARNLAQKPVPKPAVPVEPIGAIVEAFRSHSVVALGTGAHGNEQAHAFQLSLIRDSRFALAVNDIVVEFASARYQDVMDRFVRGEDVPNESLRQAWQNTTQPHGPSDRPTTEEFFQAVRAVNASLTRERQLRVLLGDPPIDWDTVRSREDYARQMQQLAGRDLYPAELIQREVLRKQRRALIVYGDGHVFRVPIVETITSLLESAGTKVFTIGAPISTPSSPDLASSSPMRHRGQCPVLSTLRAP